MIFSKKRGHEKRLERSSKPIFLPSELVIVNQPPRREKGIEPSNNRRLGGGLA